MAKRILALLLAVMMIACVTACEEEKKVNKTDKDSSVSEVVSDDGDNGVESEEPAPVISNVAEGNVSADDNKADTDEDADDNKADTGEDYIGVYTCLALSAEGMTIDPSALGTDMTIEIKADGKGVVTSEGEAQDMEYVLDGNKIAMTIDGDTQEATIEDGVLNMELMGVQMWLVKEGASLPAEVEEQLQDIGDIVDSGVEPDDSVIAVYTCLAASSAGVTFNPDAYDMVMTIELKADGEGVMVVEDEEFDITYSLDGTEITIVDTGIPTVGIIDDGVIYIESNGTEMWYVKEGASLPADVADKIEELPLATDDDVTGVYTCLAAGSEDIIFNPADIGMESTIELKADGEVWMVVDGEGFEGNYTVTDGAIVITDETGFSTECSLEDGVLVVEQDGSIMWYVKEGASLPADIEAQLQDIGGLLG